MNYYEKYLKYKNKYVNLKNLTKSLSMKGGNDMKGGGMEVFCTVMKGGKVNEFKRQFKLYLSKIKYFEIRLEPYLEKIENHSYIKLPIIKNKSYIYENKYLNRLYIEKVSKDYKKMISGIFPLKEYTYKYNKNTNQISIIFKPSESDLKWLIRENRNNKYLDINEIIELYDNIFFDEIKNGPDGWLCGDITYIKQNEIDNYEYTINVKYIKLIPNLETDKKLNKDRPSPSESATLFDIGTKKIGNDGNEWIIKENKNGVKKWSKI